MQTNLLMSPERSDLQMSRMFLDFPRLPGEGLDEYFDRKEGYGRVGTHTLDGRVPSVLGCQVVQHFSRSAESVARVCGDLALQVIVPGKTVSLLELFEKLGESWLYTLQLGEKSWNLISGLTKEICERNGTISRPESNKHILTDYAGQTHDIPLTFFLLRK